MRRVSRRTVLVTYRFDLGPLAERAHRLEEVPPGRMKQPCRTHDIMAAIQLLHRNLTGQLAQAVRGKRPRQVEFVIRTNGGAVKYVVSRYVKQGNSGRRRGQCEVSRTQRVDSVCLRRVAFRPVHVVVCGGVDYQIRSERGNRL